MYDHLTSNLKIEDKLIVDRIRFIKQLIQQRKLKTEFELINQNENLASEKMQKSLRP